MKINFKFIQNVKLTPTAHKILLYFLSIYHESAAKYIIGYITYNKLSEIIGATISNTSIAINQLIDNGIIYQKNKDYYFSDEFIIEKQKK